MKAMPQRVSGIAVPLLAGLMLVLAAPAGFAAKKPPKREPGADLFTNGPVLRLRLEIDKTGMESLRKEPRKFVRAQVTDVTTGTNIYTDVAVHLKGAAGSTQGVDAKPGLTLSFGKFTPEQTFQGLRKMHLNNSVQDKSYSTEYLCGLLFHESGVPGPRVTNARVWLNGRDLGFFVVIEGFTKDLLGRYFKNTKGVLYDGGFLRDVDAALDVESGDPKTDRADLKALVAAAKEPDPLQRWGKLDAVLDLDRFISYMAMEILVWDWDGYPLNRNNYRVYHDPTSDKMVFLPHGMDQMFWSADGPLRSPNFQGLVAKEIIRTPEGRRAYIERLGTLFTNVFKLEVMTNRLQQLYERNRPVIEELGKDEIKNYEDNTKIVRDRVIQRWHGVQKQLDQPPAPPLAFTDGVALLRQWRKQIPQTQTNSAKLEQVKDSEGKSTLAITALTNSVASWRVRATLEAGRYRLEGTARTAGVEPIPPQPDEKKGEGAGLRISSVTGVGMTLKSRANKLSGDTPWTKLDYEFDVLPPGDERELICELRARKGQAWFDLDSLQLLKLK